MMRKQRNLQNEELHNFYSESSIMKMIINNFEMNRI